MIRASPPILANLAFIRGWREFADPNKSETARDSGCPGLRAGYFLVSYTHGRRPPLPVGHGDEIKGGEEEREAKSS